MRKRTQQRAKQSIFLDAVHPSDFLHKNITYCCEQCSHFDPVKETCTIGYNASLHRREKQLKTYEFGGRMALCRFMEID